jgi:CRP-like cAMP-binding protein
VLDGFPRNAQVIAIGPVRCLAVASWDLEELLLEDPRLALAIIRGLAARLRAATEAATH